MGKSRLKGRNFTCGCLIKFSNLNTVLNVILKFKLYTYFHLIKQNKPLNNKMYSFWALSVMTFHSYNFSLYYSVQCTGKTQNTITYLPLEPVKHVISRSYFIPVPRYFFL